MKIIIIGWCVILLVWTPGWIHAAPAEPTAPVTHTLYEVQNLQPLGMMELRNMVQPISFEFGVRSDQVVTDARLDLVYTLSPALLPVVSHIKVYLNDELMKVLPVTRSQAGERVKQTISLDPRYVTDFNRVLLELVGHYQRQCEDPLHSSLWVNISKQSRLQLTLQGLPVKGDLAQFPEPFFDPRDFSPLSLPLVFAGTPGVAQQRAAAIVASWFGARAGWRTQHFPVLFEQLPDRHGVVFAANGNRPAFLADYPQVSGPTIAVVNHPDTPYIKLLLILGRNDDELVTASRALALGSVALRGQSVQVEEVAEVIPRKPYDAPNWVRTDSAMSFRELMEYEQQLQVSGLDPRPIEINFKVPPDLFTWRSQGIPLQLKYRYTSPLEQDESRLNVKVNHQFIQAFHLQQSGIGGQSERVRLPLLSNLLHGAENEVMIPALKMGANNQLSFEFNFASQVRGSFEEGACQTVMPVDVSGAVDADSSIDFSGYYHYMRMPDLRAFTSSGFPFTRLADLSETMVVMPASPAREQLELLFSIMGQMGASTGYPVTRVELTDQWPPLHLADKDLLLIGDLPEALAGDQLPAWVANSSNRMSAPRRNTVGRQPLPGPAQDPLSESATRVTLSSEGPLAVIVGFQSPFARQRSVVAMMASSPRDYRLINIALNDPEQRARVSGSMTVLRDGNTESIQIGDGYFIGSLPWWLLLWYHLSGHPVILALLAALAVVLVAVALWTSLRWLAHRRLQEGEGRPS